MEKIEAKILGLNIKAERNRKSLSQEQLAEQVDMSARSICKIESGQQNISAIKLVAIAKALNIDINELVRGL